MATKVKPTRLNVTGVPQVGQAPLYIDESTMQWGDVGSSGYGRFLSLWNASTGQPISFPESTPYTYVTGDYFMVEIVSTATPPVNYRPDGASYTGTASSVTESDELEVGDVYVYDGTVWLLQSNHGKTVTFANIAGQPTDNLSLAADLNAKQDTLTAGTGIDITSNTVSTASIYGESSTAAATVQKEVSIPSITSLDVGQVIIVKPTVTSTVAASTLKLNNFPAYKMLYNAAEITTSTDSIVWGANIPSMFYLDEVSGTKYWRFLGHGLDSNSTYTLNQLLDAGRYKAGVGTYAITRYSLCMMKADGTWEKLTATNANYSTSTTKNVNTNGFVLNQIKYYNTTTTVAGGAFVATNTFASQAATLTLSYSFNCGTAPGWSVGDPIYIVGTIGVDGLFYLDTTARWSTTLPSTNDGKLYIRIGTALDSTNSTASFLQDRPIFYYDNGIKEYTSSKQDKLTAGTGISISSNTVSNTGVTSFNGSTGAVTYTAPVTSVNTQTGAVVLDADDISDTGTTNLWTNATEKSTWNGKQNALSTQTAYTSKGTSTKVATITTNTLGQVTAVTETSIAFPVTSVNGNTGAVTGLQSQHTATTATLSSASWTSHTQTVSVTGVTASNTVLISPAPSSFAAYTNAVIYCSAQASGTLTFNCTTDPTSNITVNIIILD